MADTFGIAVTNTGRDVLIPLRWLQSNEMMMMCMCVCD
jgi:hypothetical protein